MISAKHAHLVAFDNLSAIPTWLSDSFCRLATGGGLATRQLYTDEKQMIFQACRPVLLNGITELAERGDLLDRVVNLHLPPIPAGLRKNEADFWNEFEAAKPRVFGALLDVLSKVLQRVKDVHIPNLPRMADFAVWATAAEEALGFGSGEFFAAYERNRTESSLHALECSPAASEVINLARDCAPWEGTHSELLAQVNLRTAEKGAIPSGRRVGGPWRQCWPGLNRTSRRLGLNSHAFNDRAEQERGKSGSRSSHRHKCVRNPLPAESVTM